MAKIIKRVVVVLFIIAVLGVGGMAAFLTIGKGTPKDVALEALKSDNAVTVTKSGIITTFVGPDEDPNNTYGLVFYQGAKVEADAYAPLLHELAAQGWTCVIVDLPLNFAMLDGDAAGRVIPTLPEVEHWYVGGHSLGGLVASQYAQKNSAEVEGLIMLGSFTTYDLTKSGLNVISIYGTNDTVLNKDSYNKGLALYPSTFHEQIIEGGNHAQFGDYGDQDNDTPATISASEQVAQTVSAIQSYR